MNEARGVPSSNPSPLNLFLNHSSLKNHLYKFNESANIFLEKLRSLADGKTDVSMKEAFNKVALDVINKVCR